MSLAALAATGLCVSCSFESIVEYYRVMTVDPKTVKASFSSPIWFGYLGEIQGEYYESRINVSTEPHRRTITHYERLGQSPAVMLDLLTIHADGTLIYRDKRQVVARLQDVTVLAQTDYFYAEEYRQAPPDVLVNVDRDLGWQVPREVQALPGSPPPTLTGAAIVRVLKQTDGSVVVGSANYGFNGRVKALNTRSLHQGRVDDSTVTFPVNGHIFGNGTSLVDEPGNRVAFGFPEQFTVSNMRLTLLAVLGALLGAFVAAPSRAQAPRPDATTLARTGLLERLAERTGVYGLPPTAKTPGFVADAGWPQKVPHNWIIGQVGGLYVAPDDHIWIYQRPRTLTNDEAALTDATNRTKDGKPVDPMGFLRPYGALGDCCLPAPSVMEFDSNGTLLRAWGGPADPDKCKMEEGCVWPASGTPQFYLPADITVDPTDNRMYISDGYGNRRVVIVDAATGKYIGHFGAYGNNPIDDKAAAAAGVWMNDLTKGNMKPAFFRTPVHCVKISKEGLIYVCDRGNNRLQVFNGRDPNLGKECANPAGEVGKCGFVKEQFVSVKTNGLPGSAVSMNFSTDAKQSCLYVGDNSNMTIYVLKRDTLEEFGRLGRSGREAGEFHWLHQVEASTSLSSYRFDVFSARFHDRHRVTRRWAAASSPFRTAARTPLRAARAL